MNKLETMIIKLGGDLLDLAKAAMTEYGFYGTWNTLPVEVKSYSTNDFLETSLEDTDGDYEAAFKRVQADSRKIFQTGTYFDPDTNKICQIEFMINEPMIAYLLASYGGIDSVMLEDYLYECCKHEIGHMIDALKTFDGSKGKDAFNEYYSSLAKEYIEYNRWHDAQDPETMTTAKARMEYYKIPREQRANEYGHVNLDLLFQVLQQIDEVDDDDIERE